MVLPIAAAAAKAVGAAGSAAGTAIGISMEQTDLDLSLNLFKEQMRQTKRLWTADWAEASVRHGESILQAAQHHSEGQALSTASYYQAEKLASQGIKLARDQDSRSYEMAWRAEVRESLRDELVNQNNRFNIIMLCDTVCLGCVFTLVADGSPPDDTPTYMLNAYAFCLGVSIMLCSISLWGSIIVVRRLHDNTAARLERKLFAQSEDLQIAWQQQLINNVPTGPQEISLLHQAYEKWVVEYIEPMGKMSINMLSIGVVTMVIGAGILVDCVHLIQYNDVVSGRIFYSSVFVTCTSMLYMKFSEDRKEKKKEGVYDVSWQDQSTAENGPFAKIDKAAEELSRSSVAELGSLERAESFGRRERIERDFCANTQLLNYRTESLRGESDSRAKIRKEVLQLLTTAAEELDALPEELTSHTNKILYSIDEADMRTADLVTTQTESEHNLQEKEKLPIRPTLGSKIRHRNILPSTSKELMGAHPIDAQRIPVSLGSLRKKLGEFSTTTLLRIKNTSNEPLRLKSGVQLEAGRYIKSLNANDPRGNEVCFHLYPGTEIPPWTEILIASHSFGWFLPSGIAGKLVYTNHDESWTFEIIFRNNLFGNVRRCHVKAYPASRVGKDSIKSSEEDMQYWKISKDEYDGKANNEIVVSFKVVHEEEAEKASLISLC